MYIYYIPREEFPLGAALDVLHAAFLLHFSNYVFGTTRLLPLKNYLI